MSVSVVVVAAGSGERLGHNRPKAFVDCRGKSLLEHSLHALNELVENLQVIIVAPEAWRGAADDLASSTLDARHQVAVVSGGATRSDSVRNGLAVLEASADLVLIHDAARSLCPAAVFERVIDRLRAGADGVIPTLPVVDTLSPQDDGTGVTGSAIDRSELAIVQTPQGFRKTAVVDAHTRFPDTATDDADIVRRAGYEVVAVDGDHRAFKITHPADLERAFHLLGSGDGETRVGIGVDVHAFDPESALWLGGVFWEGEPGLAGHSDGDVVIHAICDALLQASGLGDLGTLFGESRPEFEGARSTVFLSHVVELVGHHGFRPQSVSCQLVANTPRFAPRREEVWAALTAMVGAPVHVAATTSDGLGLTGRGEGAAAVAVALVARRTGHHPSSK